MKSFSGASALAAVLLASAAFAQNITRGPFLQSSDETGITVVFLTDTATVATLRYGTAPGALASVKTDASATTEHVFKLSGLTAGTRYWYSVEVSGQPALKGPEFTFRTHPVKGSPEPFRFIAFGDSGTGGTGQLAVAERMAALNAKPDFGLILGDIIYPAGEAANYDPRYFAPYRELLRKIVVWPTIGNHDAATASGQPYRDAFHLPTNNPAGSEMYHSWDYGNAHFVCLDTHVSGYAAGSAQLQWAAQDLAASDATWKIVYFHVPPYSGGTHSDSAGVKANVLPVLEAAGVDVVFSGHSHVYERTFLLKANTIVQNNAATYDQRVAPGSIYVVSGTAGQSGALSNASHPLMAYQQGNTLGTSIIEVEGPVLRGYFLDSNNQAFDLFTLFKNDDTQAPALAGVRARSTTQVEVSFTEPVGTGAATASSYLITPPVAVLGATVQSDARTVLLDTAAHPGGTFTLSVSGVKDSAQPANPIPAGSNAQYDIPLDFVSRGGPWRYLVGTVDPPANWASAEFGDGAWTAGNAPIGYGETGIVSSVPAGTITTYARATFGLGSTLGISRLTLSVRYDDGVVVFLNGTEVARRGVPAGQTRTTLATSHEATSFETIELSAHIGLLKTGMNVLAVEVHNVGSTSSDLVLDAELKGERREVSLPYVASYAPANDARGVGRDVVITAVVKDEGADLDPGGITLSIGGEAVTPELGGTARERTVSFAPSGGFAASTIVEVELGATNAAGAEMVPLRWSFATAAAPVGEADGGSAYDGGVETTREELPATVNTSCGCFGGGDGLTALALLALLAVRHRRRG